MLKTLLGLLLLVCFLPSCYAQKNGYPTDGNKLLDACSVLVEAADNPTTITSLSGDRFTETMSQFSWCAGYLEGIHDTLIQNQVTLGLMGMMGMTLTGSDEKKAWAVEHLHGACIPDKAPILQIARVLVKWLREHPARLHESKGVLTTAALQEEFACRPPTPRKRPTQRQRNLKVKTKPRFSSGLRSERSSLYTIRRFI